MLAMKLSDNSPGSGTMLQAIIAMKTIPSSFLLLLSLT
jgi:hypothetical protein